MELLTTEILERLPARYSQMGQRDPLVICTFFTPDAPYHWFVIEGDPCAVHGYDFYGYIIGAFAEFGSFTLAELRAIRGVLGLPVERETDFVPMPVSVIRARYAHLAA